jgi:hypothetical protein
LWLSLTPSSGYHRQYGLQKCVAPALEVRPFVRGIHFVRMRFRDTHGRLLVLRR